MFLVLVTTSPKWNHLTRKFFFTLCGGPEKGLLMCDSDGLVLDWPSFALVNDLAPGKHGMKQFDEAISGEKVIPSCYYRLYQLSLASWMTPLNILIAILVFTSFQSNSGLVTELVIPDDNPVWFWPIENICTMAQCIVGDATVTPHLYHCLKSWADACNQLNRNTKEFDLVGITWRGLFNGATQIQFLSSNVVSWLQQSHCSQLFLPPAW